MRRRVVAIVLTVPLLVVTALVLVGGLAAWRWATRSTQFDAARWKAEQGKDCFQMSRSDMVDDLRRHHLSRGMTTREVRRLLGEPDYSIGADLRGRGIWWDYLTGADLVDCSTLGLRFKDGQLEQTAIGQT